MNTRNMLMWWINSLFSDKLYIWLPVSLISVAVLPSLYIIALMEGRK